jgi:serralysin
MMGGLGNDVYVVDSALDTIVDTGGTDTVETVLSSLSIASFGTVENLTYTGSGDFLGIGNAVANQITGGTGNDTLNGGAGADVLIGGLGNDTYVVDNAGDVLVESGTGVDTVMSSVTWALNADFENLTLTGTGNVNGTGNAGANTLIGNNGNNTLDGQAGADAMAGGVGNDTYVVDNVGDVVTESAGAGTDLVRTSLGSYTLGDNVENLVFTGTGGFTGTGNALANTITGGAGGDRLDGADGNDTLNGGGANDIMIGGSGNDTMNGGAGNDTFVFAPGFGNDTISGFDANPAGGQDLIDFSALGITFANVSVTLDVSGGTLLTVGADTITLLGVNPATINATDFFF